MSIIGQDARGCSEQLAMFKSGWVRLWVVLSAVILTGAAIASADYVWGPDACYSFVSITLTDNPEQQDKQLADHIKQDATSKIFCGGVQYSELLTLEDLARRGVVTQVGFQWREPRGWSFSDYDVLEVLDTNDIKASEIISRVSSYVYRARFLDLIRPLAAAILTCAFMLAIGLGIAWIRRGFEE